VTTLRRDLEIRDETSRLSYSDIAGPPTARPPHLAGGSEVRQMTCNYRGGLLAGDRRAKGKELSGHREK